MAKRIIDQVSPTVVIGLGGSGAKVVAGLKRRFGEGQPPIVSFLVIDSDKKARVQEDVEIRDHEFLHIAWDMPVKEIIEKRFDVPPLELDTTKAILKWFPSEPSSSYRYLPEPLTDGAKRVRALGRLLLFKDIKSINTMLQQHLGWVARDENQRMTQGEPWHYQVNANDRRAFIVASLGGGQGTGAFIDIAYLVRRLKPDFEVNAVLLLPGAFVQEQEVPDSPVKANSYAAIMELDHYMSNRTFHCDYGSIKVNSTERPFKYVYLLTGKIREQKRGELTLEQVTDTAVEGIINHMGFLTDSVDQGRWTGDIDMQLESKHRNEYRCYNSFGYSSKRLPGDQVAQYCRYRLGEKIADHLCSDKPRDRVEDLLEARATDLTNKIKPDSIRSQFPRPAFARMRVLPVGSKNLIENLNKEKEGIQANIGPAEEKLRREASELIENLKVDLARNLREVASDPGYGPLFAIDLIPKISAAIAEFMKEIDKKLKGPTVVKGVKSIIDRLVIQQRMQKSAEKHLLNKISSVVPLSLKRASMEKALANLVAAINEEIELEMEKCTLELINELLDDLRGWLASDLRRQWKKLIPILEQVESHFEARKKELRAELTRSAGVYGERVVFTHAQLKDLSQLDFGKQKSDLMLQEKLFALNLEEPDEVNQKRIFDLISEWIKSKFSEWDDKSLLDYLEEQHGEAEVKAVMDDLHKTASALWQRREPPSETCVIQMAGIEEGKADEVRTMLGSMGRGGTHVQRISDKQRVSVSRFEYCLPVSWIPELADCEDDFRSEAEAGGDLYTNFSEDFQNALAESPLSVKLKTSSM
ncbi:tubulin-like doman-containing protein [Dehalococcoidia bacterium]|nr:tubulin-like doman-containing protein [Dehalococcoidia bacterium]